MLPITVKILTTSIITGAIALIVMEELKWAGTMWEIFRGILIVSILTIIGSVLWIVWT